MFSAVLRVKEHVSHAKYEQLIMVLHKYRDRKYSTDVVVYKVRKLLKTEDPRFLLVRRNVAASSLLQATHTVVEWSGVYAMAAQVPSSEACARHQR